MNQNTFQKDTHDAGTQAAGLILEQTQSAMEQGFSLSHKAMTSAFGSFQALLGAKSPEDQGKVIEKHFNDLQAQGAELAKVGQAMLGEQVRMATQLGEIARGRGEAVASMASNAASGGRKSK